MEQAGRLIVRIQVEGADDEEIDRMARQLLTEVRDGSDVAEADLVSSPAGPSGAKAGELIQFGQLAVQAAPAAIPGLVLVLRAWAARPRPIPVRVAVEVRDRAVSVEYPVGAMTHDDLLELVSLVEKRHSSG